MRDEYLQCIIYVSNVPHFNAFSLILKIILLSAILTSHNSMHGLAFFPLPPGKLVFQKNLKYNYSLKLDMIQKP